MMGHFSIDRTVARIMQLYGFPGLRSYVRAHIKTCRECLLVKIPSGNKPGELHSIPPPSRPFLRLHLDHNKWKRKRI